MKKILFILLFTYLNTASILAQTAIREDISVALNLHREYKFDKAISIYNTISSNVLDSLLKLELDSLILQSENSKTLVEFASHPKLVDYKDVSNNDFFLYYSSLPQGIWIETPKSLLNGMEHKYGNVIYAPNNSKELYFSAPDKNGAWNIYIIRNLNDNIWSTPELVNTNITSTGDEIFPIISKDGKSLYFSSNGHYGMGGYDLYVSRWNDDIDDWGVAQNLGFPYSSTGDDLLFIDSPDGQFSLMSSNRDTSGDSLRIYALEFNNIPIKEKIESTSELYKLAKLGVGKNTVELPESNKSENNLKDQTTDNKALEDYSEKVKNIRKLQTKIDEINNVIQKNRELYASLSNANDKVLIAKKISEAEINIMSIQSEISKATKDIQMIEIDFLQKGIIPSNNLNEDPKQIDEDKNQLSFHFRKMPYGIFFPMEILKPEPTIDLSFKIGETAFILEDNSLPDQLIYQIQLFTLSAPAAIKALKGLSPIFENKTRTGKYIYRVGIFYSYSEVLANLNKVKRLGFSSAMITAFNKGESLSTRVARDLEKRQENNNSYQIILDMFPLGIPTPIITRLRESFDKDIAKSTENNKTIYVIGPFGSKREAEKIQKILSDLAVDGIRIEEIKQ